MIHNLEIMERGLLAHKIEKSKGLNVLMSPLFCLINFFSSRVKEVSENRNSGIAGLRRDTCFPRLVPDTRLFGPKAMAAVTGPD